MSANTLANQLHPLSEEDMKLALCLFSDPEDAVGDLQRSSGEQEHLNMQQVPEFTDEQLQALKDYFMTNEELIRWDICFADYIDSLPHDQTDPECWDQRIFNYPKQWAESYWPIIVLKYEESDIQFMSIIYAKWEYALSSTCYSADAGEKLALLSLSPLYGQKSSYSSNGLRRESSASSVSCGSSRDDPVPQVLRTRRTFSLEEGPTVQRNALKRRASEMKESQAKRRLSQNIH